ncbi:MAG: PorP/SprF family type IX secretion system membrane protein [Bacteroidales bacterium]|nr:PorP/SprF family type IX secretion system membrane protein [Bacteroidales bacterium]
MRGCIFLVILFAGLASSAQDIHFSQFNDAPLTLNPALTGVVPYKGIDENMIRAGGNFKNQGAGIAVPYRTYDIFVDGALSLPRLKRTQLGLGLLLYNDNAGDGSLQNTSAMLNAALTIAFNRNYSFRATLGFSIGFINRSVDVTKLVFDNQWNGVIFDPGASSNENFSTNSIFAVNFNFGGLLTYEVNRKLFLRAGASLSHINKPRTSFYDDDNRINPKLIAHADAIVNTGENLTVEPGFMYSVQAKTYELVLGTNLTLTKRDIQLIFGLWYRLNRDLIPLVGIRYQGYKLAITYDVNVSPLSIASNYQGGIEISFIKVFGRKNRGIPCSTFE